jgi:glutamate-1-semialdehyde aminotransferase
MGFGSVFFGHNYGPVREAIEEQLSKSWSVGPISPLAGKLAKEICALVGAERTAFFNSGTEAVMVALRAAKAATGKKYIVYFKGSYHGTFDPLLSLKSSSDNNLAQEIVPGVTQSILNESYLLRFGDDSSLDFIREHSDEIAAVLTEPVQSRNPGYQPLEFLKTLRAITEKNNIALVFDEVLTGFRMDVGGCQKLFGIKADIVTYGKVIGGGLPIGIVAGKSKYLDTLDGGFWHFDDDSVPSVKQTFVAGTFCHHPLAMAASLKIIEILKGTGESVINDLNEKTRLFSERMNSFFQESGYAISISHFGSLFRFNTPGKSSFLYHQLLLNNVYIWDDKHQRCNTIS